MKKVLFAAIILIFFSVLLAGFISAKLDWKLSLRGSEGQIKSFSDASNLQASKIKFSAFLKEESYSVLVTSGTATLSVNAKNSAGESVFISLNLKQKTTSVNEYFTEFFVDNTAKGTYSKKSKAQSSSVHLECPSVKYNYSYSTGLTSIKANCNTISFEIDNIKTRLLN